MYSFAQRKDTTVVDEPLYAHFLTNSTTDADHPGKSEILKSQHAEGNKVINEVLFGPYPTPVAIFKQMTHHLIELDLGFLLEMHNVLLIRNPRAIIASYSKVIPNPGMQDIGVKQQFELYQRLKSAGKLNAIVDAKELLLAPEKVLRELCHRLGIDFCKDMLHWEAGARPEDGSWAPYWYANVHQSTGFHPYHEKSIALRPDLESLAQECLPYYSPLYEEAIKASN
ncbi:MAG: hypothetical protein DHS20C18_37620 [Saprospiraceae bacterium]|nr:MAG: hypothetical protein DHS20C18_37620 [Saprospiraceae bacterium]